MITLAVSEANFVLGPADLWVAPSGTALPTTAAADPGTGWTNVGATDGGVKVEIDETVTDLNADQVLLAVGGRVTGQAITVTATLSEITLANLAMTMATDPALTQGTSGATPTDSKLSADDSTSSTQTSYLSIIVDGWAPRGKTTGQSLRRRILVPKTLPETKTSLTFDKKTQQGLAVTFHAYLPDDPSVPSWDFLDENETTA